MSYRVAVWGATGMAGGELLRILANHPDLEVVCAVSRGSAGKPLWHDHPHLRLWYPEMVYSSPDGAMDIPTDLVFLALPHRGAWKVAVDYRERGVKVVDLSGDFRLKDPAQYARWYGEEHGAPAYLEQAVYGLPELHRDDIASSSLVSGVGCNASCAILGLAPLASTGLVDSVRMELRVGSSEAGGSPSKGSHHPYRTRTMRVFEPFRHRHLAEVIQETGLPEELFTMTMTAVEMVRGAQMLAQVTLKEPVKEAVLWKAYRRATEGRPFWNVCPARPSHLRLPDPRFVLGSNHCSVGFVLHEDGVRLLVVSALDNLMKGASGSAVQAANLMLGLEETSGLDGAPMYPA